MKIIGLTGGIGMGKSTAAAAFRRAGLPVFDADAAVHRLQAKGGRAVPAIAAAFPGTVRGGAVDRALLRRAAIGDPAAMSTLERILHPLVRQDERAFLRRARRAGCRAAVLDVPLLLETMASRPIHGQGGPGLGGRSRGARRGLDLVVVVSAPPAVQAARVQGRRRMTPAQAQAIIARQMPDRDKRRQADVVVHTGLSRHHAQRRLRRLVLGLLGNALPRVGP